MPCWGWMRRLLPGSVVMTVFPWKHSPCLVTRDKHWTPQPHEGSEHEEVVGVCCREEECNRWRWAPLVLAYSSGLVNLESSTAICLKVLNFTFHKAVKKCWSIMALVSPQAMIDGSCCMGAQLLPPITGQIYTISLGPHWVKLQVSTVCLITCLLLAILPSLSYFLPHSWCFTLPPSDHSHSLSQGLFLGEPRLKQDGSQLRKTEEEVQCSLKSRWVTCRNNCLPEV